MKRIILSTLIGVILFCNIVIARHDTRLLILTSDAFEEHISPLVLQKTRMGWTPKVLVLPSGSDRFTIKSAVQDSLASWGFTPEYLLIVGSDAQLNYSNAYGSGTDTDYGDLDYEIGSEIYTGRLPVETVTQLEGVIEKIRQYELSPNHAGYLDWLTKGCLVVNEDGAAGDSIYRNTIHHVAELMEDADWTQIDTLGTDGHSGNGTDVRNSIHEGRGYVIFRGQGVESWWGFDVSPETLDNQGMYPVVSGTTCRTILVLGPKWINNTHGGAILYLGTQTVSGGMILSQQRSAMALGFADGLFAGMHAGRAAELGREYVLDIDDPTSTREFAACVLLGDPTIRLWTQIPESLFVEHLPTYAVGESEMAVTVYDEHMMPLEGATVTIIIDTVVVEYDFTDFSGNIVLPYAYTGSGTDSMEIWVSSWNHYVYSATIPPLNDTPFPVVSKMSVNDTLTGNGNGKVQRGETITIDLDIMNLGMESTGDILLTAASDADEVSVSDTVVSIPSLDSLEMVQINDCFETTIAGWAVPGAVYAIVFTVETPDTVFSYSRNLPPISTSEPTLGVINIADFGPGGNDDGILTWGESLLLESLLRNIGNTDIATVTLRFTDNIHCHICPEEITLHNIPPGESFDLMPVSISLNPFHSSYMEFNIPVTLTFDEGFEFEWTASDAIELSVYPPEGPISPSEWLVVDEFLAYESIPEDSVFSGGETVLINLTIENIGSVDAENVSILIRPNPDFGSVHSVDSLMSAGDIYTGESWDNPTPFSIFLEDIPRDGLLPIEIWMVNVDFSYYNVMTQYIQIQAGSGINKYQLPQRLMTCCHPNPFNGSVEIDLPGDLPCNVIITDIQGRPVFSTQSKESMTWTPDNLPTGVYLVNVHSGDFFEKKNVLYLK